MTKTPKRFDQWNILKKEMDQESALKTFKERDVVFLKMGENVGFEQSGKGKEFLRPVLVYKKFSKYTFLGIPLTTTQKDSPFYVTFPLKRKMSTVILSQVRLFDTKRISYFYGRISTGNFRRIKEKLIKLLQ